MDYGLARRRRSLLTLRPRARRALLEALESRRLLAGDLSIWGDAATPAVSADADNVPIEVGVKFRSDVAGDITGLRFYKGDTNTGTHVADLWSAGGTLLGAATFAGETASGWQTATFSTPVSIDANTTYVASYHTDVGHYATTEGAFASAGVDNGPLHALASGVDGGNGVYVYGTSAFPTQSFDATNYWVDVTFSPASADTTPPAVTATSPASGATDVPTDSTVAATFDESVDPATLAFTVVDGANVAVPGTTAYDDATKTATFTPTSALAEGTSYTATVSASDLAGNAMPVAVAWTFGTVEPQVTTLSIWDDSATPAVSADADNVPIEVGVKFRSDVAGDITGLRFYKGAENTGTHIGSLWSADGTLLRTATFTSETDSGWQTVTFDEPLEITADTTYVASYHTDVGHYSTTEGAFASAGADNGPLHALASGVDGGNGVYVYGASAFPTQSLGATNYWVDVTFVASSDPGGTAPAAPTGLAAAAASSSQVELAWNDNATDETGYRIERSTDGVNFTPIATLPADMVLYTDTGLSPSTHYFYRVFAVNDAGDSDPSNTADTTTLAPEATAPAAPTGLTAAAASSSEIDLAWTDNATNETGYRVERSTDGASFTPVRTLAAGATSFADTGLAASTHYFYRVFAVNAADDSDPSNTADATTPNGTTPGTPVKLTGTPIGTAGSWNDSGNTFDKALDGDVNTYFDAANPNGNFVGLALATPSVITSARVYPRWSFAWRMTGGKIQGSNDNATWTDLATITSQPADGTFTTLAITDPTAYRYVRYLSPDAGFGNVAEVEFYTNGTTPPPPTGTPVKLTGTGIGSAGSWNNSGNTFDKAIDGNVNTFFDAPVPAGQFVGLSLGSATEITSARIYPRSGFAWRVTGAKIQGSNDDATWTDLATITSQPADGTFTEVAITDTTEYKFVRYLSPSEGFGNVAEVEFYGLANTPPPPTNSSKLTGGAIGTPGSWNNSGNTLDKALDGDVHTYFDAPTPNGNFVGLSLASPAVITSARIYPRDGFAWRVTGAKIQGSNDNATWTDLATVTSQPADGTFTTLTITDPTAYKYVRYLSPDAGFGNVAEVEFYGKTA